MANLTLKEKLKKQNMSLLINLMLVNAKNLSMENLASEIYESALPPNQTNASNQTNANDDVQKKNIENYLKGNNFPQSKQLTKILNYFNKKYNL
ncbi:hypothetical protein SAMN05421644_1892 [Allochromatium warmingii]|uniref:Uncharacterized protein n=1 Tax=Allochromatium warmingii TaxID=61595 RepID=A0A1H3KEA1_ALLWA|nr:hypothetical protein [Allochromatium warmingii]SDY49928.1 hypothetical protein SAMN05421644_1892 [Allochromatium warmingii]